MNLDSWIVPYPAPSGNSAYKTALPACLAGLTAVTCFLWLSRPFQFPFDDSYIALEFARNLAATGHLTYDGIHTIAGTSAVLHIMLLSIPARLGLPLEMANLVIGILFFVLLIERTAALAMRLTQSHAASLYAALATALTGYLVYDALNGMETTLFMFLTVTCIESVIRSCTEGKGYAWSGFWIFLTVMGRPEGIWFAGSLIFYLVVLGLRQRQEIPKLAKLALHLCGGVVVGLLTLRVVQGAFTPHAALSKVYFYNQFRHSLHWRLWTYQHNLSMIWSVLLLSLLPLAWARKARPLLLIILPWVVVTQFMFIMLLPMEVSSYEGRYLHPFMPILFILAGDGVNNLWYGTGRFRIPRVATAALLASIAAIAFLNLETVLANYHNDKTIILNNDIWASDWLKAHAPASSRVAAYDIGALRYYGRYELVDLCGLTNEEVTEINHAQKGQVDYLLGKRPDYLVGDDIWLKTYFHFDPAKHSCVSDVATAHTNALTTIQFHVYHLQWDHNTNDCRK
jgi:hypothetical protein